MAEARPTLIRGGLILSMAEEQPFRGDVLVAQGRIADISRSPIEHSDAQLLDASQCIVLPGLIDTHRHVFQPALRGVTADMSLKEYLWAVRINAARHYKPEDIYCGTFAGMLEALDAGVTTVVDYANTLTTPEHADAAIAGHREAGSRALFCYGMENTKNSIFNNLADRQADLGRIAQDLQGDTYVALGMSTSDPDAYGGGVEAERRVIDEFALGRRLDLRITLHANVVVKKTNNSSHVNFLDAAGMLGPKILWIHMNSATDEELRRVAETGGWISATPETELQMAMGMHVFGRMLRMGNRCTWGVDSVANNSGDLFNQMRIGLQTIRLEQTDSDLRLHSRQADHIAPPSVRDVLRGSTLDAACAIGRESEIGSLEVGKLADIITVRCDAPNTFPVNDPYGTVVLQAHAGNVDTVMVGGVVRKSGGKVAGYERAKELLGESHERIAAAVANGGGYLPAGAAPLW